MRQHNKNMTHVPVQKTRCREKTNDSLTYRQPASTTSSKRRSIFGSERGALLLIIFLLILSIASIYVVIRAYKAERERAIIAYNKRQNIGVKCRRAIQKVRIALESEKKATGKYPYEFTEEFMNRYKTIDRFVYNLEIWSLHADNELKLETSFGESYELIGYCRDGHAYIYDSLDNKLYDDDYSTEDFE